MCKKFQTLRAGLEDCVIFYRFIARLSELIEQMRTYQNVHVDKFTQKYIEPLEVLNEQFSKFQTLVEETVDMTALENNEYLVDPGFDEVLTDLSEKMEKVKNRIRKREDKVKVDLGSPPSFKIERDKVNGFFFSVTKKDEKYLKKTGSAFAYLPGGHGKVCL